MRSVGYIGGRSINLALSTRGWTALEKVGLTQEIEAISIPMYGRVIHQKDGSTDYQPYGKENEAIYSVSRGELNKRLVELADNFDNVKFHFNQFCQNVDLQKGEATFLNTETQQLTSVKDEMIIGTDGAFSKVRASMYTMPRFDYQQFYINYGYKELTIPAGPNGSFLIDKKANARASETLLPFICSLFFLRCSPFLLMVFVYYIILVYFEHIVMSMSLCPQGIF
jgi:kynurenine 3-monooxygenase